MNKIEKQILDNKKQYAEIKGYQLNPDQKIVDIIIAGLTRNKKEKGYEYCPCRPLEGDLGKDRKKICPCFWHKAEIKKDGFCHCRLFYKK
jgi:ferredoxin-thioredoxin reductase catalytic subunit